MKQSFSLHGADESWEKQESFTKNSPEEKKYEILAKLMIAKRGRATSTNEIPAGYTYLGQFIAHDISFNQKIAASQPPRLRLDSL